MAILIGRKKEQEILKRLYNSKEAELVVVYGRRRVGKTFLVNQTFSNQFTFKVTGLHQVRLADQLSNFMMALREYSHDNQSRKVKSWMEAFDMLKTYLISIKTTGKKVIFFDELPWMDTPNSKFLSAFEWFWNGWGNTQDNLLMVVCGSATNWIINKLFKHKGGLYNRADSKLYLRPFTLLETERYLQSRGIYWERYEIAQTYMIMGGIPYYLKQLEPGESLAKNIDQCFFQKNCTLWDEFDSLYETLFGHSEVYLKVVEALAEKKVGLTRDEIVKKTHLPNNGALSDILKKSTRMPYFNQ